MKQDNDFFVTDDRIDLYPRAAGRVLQCTLI